MKKEFEEFYAKQNDATPVTKNTMKRLYYDIMEFHNEKIDKLFIPRKKVNKNDFLDWFFSDNEDFINFGNHIKSQLKKEGFTSITIRSLFDDCGYIAGDLIEDNKEGKDYSPKDCELI